MSAPQYFNSFNDLQDERNVAILAYWDNGLVCRYATDPYLKMVGKREEEVIDRMTLKELMADEYESALPSILMGLQGKPQTYERILPLGKGITRRTVTNYFPDIWNGTVRGFFLHVTDVSLPDGAPFMSVSHNSELSATGEPAPHHALYSPIVAGLRHFNPELSDDDLNVILNNLSERHIKKGEYFLKPGQVCMEIGFVVKGSFRKYYTKGNKEAHTNFSLENEFLVSLPNVIRHEPAESSIQALEDSTLLVYRTLEIDHLFSLSQAWERFGRKISQWQIIQLNSHIESILCSSSLERYQNLLQQRPEWLRRIPLKYLASYLGIEKETLSRLRATMASQR